MKPHLQCAEQQVSRSNLTKYWKTRILSLHHIWNLIYNARSNQCHPPNSPNTAPATQNDHLTSGRNLRKTGETSFPMRGRSEHDPTMIRAWSDHENENRNPPRHRGYFSSSPGAFSIVKYNVSSPILHSNIHQALRLPRKVTPPLHEVLRLPRKVTLELHQVLHLPRKVTLELHQVLRLSERLAYLVFITYETSFTMRGATNVTLQTHQILRLPRKMTT